MRRALLVAALLLIPIGTAEDRDPPQILGIEVSGTSFVPGDEVVVRIHAKDETGLDRAYMELWGPQKAFSWPVEPSRCDNGGGAEQAWLECRIKLRDTAPAGDYLVRSVSVSDTVYHERAFELGRDFQEDGAHKVRFTVSSSNDDLEPPALHKVLFQQAVVQAGDRLDFDIHVSDGTGVAFVDATFSGPGGSPELQAECGPVGGTQVTAACWLDTSPEYPNGLYSLDQIVAWDVNEIQKWWMLGNELQPDEDHHTTFRLSSESTDEQGPGLIRVGLPQVPVPRGDTFQVRIWADDDTAVDWVYVTLNNTSGHTYQLQNIDIQPTSCTPWNNADTAVVCTGMVPKDFPLGKLTIKGIALRDPATHKTGFSPQGNFDSGHVIGAGNDTSFWVGPRPITASVDALDPEIVYVKPGTVGNVLLKGPLSTNVTFNFQGPSTLGVTSCELAYRQSAIGSICQLIVPPDAQLGTYALDRVDGRLSDPDIWLRIEGSQQAGGSPLPDDWQKWTSGGMTLAGFNGGPEVRPSIKQIAPVAPPAGPAEPTEPSGHSGKDSPLPVAWLVAGLLIGLRRRLAEGP